MSKLISMNTHTKEASFIKRFIAYVIDALCVIILTVILYNFVTSNFLFKAMGGANAASEMNTYSVESSLFKPTYSTSNPTEISTISIYTFADQKSDSTAPSDQTKSGYEEYYDRFWTFYTDFIYKDSNSTKRTTAFVNSSTITGDTPFTEDDYFSYVEMQLMGLPDPTKITLTGDAATDEALLKGTNKYFKYDLNQTGTTVDIHKRPILQIAVQTQVNSSDPANILKSLNTYFYDSTGTNSDYGLYGNAASYLMGNTSTFVPHSPTQTYYSTRYSQQNYDIWMCALVPFLPLQFIFFFILPLCLKDGQSLGKLIFSLAVVKADGFKATWKEKVIRQLYLTILGSFVLLPWTYLGLMLYVLIALIDYMVLVMSKTHQSLHDRLAKTMVISKKESLYWKDEDEMAAYAATHPEQFPELKEQHQDPEMTRIAQEDSILDLSTMNKSREAAHTMSNFDDYEKAEDAKSSAKPASNPSSVNLTKDETPDEDEKVDEQAMKDLSALEGGTPDEKGEVSEPKEAEPEPKKPDEEGFTDAPKDKKD